MSPAAPWIDVVLRERVLTRGSVMCAAHGARGADVSSLSRGQCVVVVVLAKAAAMVARSAVGERLGRRMGGPPGVSRVQYQY